MLAAIIIIAKVVSIFVITKFKLFVENHVTFEVHLQHGCDSLIFYCRMGGVEHLE